MSIEKAAELVDLWETLANFWLIAFYVLGLTSVIASTIAAARPSDSKSKLWNASAAIGAIAAGMLTFFNPKDKSERLHAAKTYLLEAIYHNGNDQRVITDAWKRGVSIISHDSLSRFDKAK